jgi:HEAT repeat protein
MIRWLAPLFLFSAGCSEMQTKTPDAQPAVAAPAAPAQDDRTAAEKKTDAQISTALVELVETKDRVRPDTLAAGPFHDILSVGSPIGYALRTRYLNVGVPVAEALSRNDDKVFRDKLVELARWDKGEVRSAALVALAGAHDPAHFDIFREALVHLDPAIRFAAMEGLIAWGFPEKVRTQLIPASEKDTEPILRVYAAGGLAKLKDPEGLPRLRRFLDDPSWLVRAMAGRFIGEYGEAADYDTLVARIGREQTNDFVLAEYCIAALKLFPKKKA